jgi:hypothetical protein
MTYGKACATGEDWFLFIYFRWSNDDILIKKKSRQVEGQVLNWLMG